MEKSKEAKKKAAITLEDLGPGFAISGQLISGSLIHKVAELMEKQEKGEALPFEKLYPMHFGNPQFLGQPPITFFNQVISATFYPKLLDEGVFHKDVGIRVKQYLSGLPAGSLGAYQDGPGHKVFRKSIEAYISKRDGWPADIDSIYLLDGAADGINFLLKFILSKDGTGVSSNIITLDASSHA